MEKIFYNQNTTTEVEKVELIKKVLTECEFKPGDVVKVKCQNSPELVVQSIDVISTKNYELNCIFLNCSIKTLMFNKSGQKYETNIFSPEVLIKIKSE